MVVIDNRRNILRIVGPGPLDREADWRIVGEREDKARYLDFLKFLIP